MTDFRPEAVLGALEAAGVRYVLTGMALPMLRALQARLRGSDR